MKNTTKKDWYEHIREVIEATNKCKNISCERCIKAYGPCVKNIAINEFAQLIEQSNLPEK